MKKTLLSVSMFLSCGFVFAQTGIGTQNPQQAFHVDGALDNNASGAPTTAQQANDFVVTTTGSTGIGTSAPASSALVDITTTTKGFLPPRLTTVQMNAIVSPAAGLYIYNTDENCPFFYNGTEWVGRCTAVYSTESMAGVTITGTNSTDLPLTFSLNFKKNASIIATFNPVTATTGSDGTTVGTYRLIIDGTAQPARDYASQNHGTFQYKPSGTVTWSGPLAAGSHTITLRVTRASGTLDTSVTARRIDVMTD